MVRVVDINCDMGESFGRYTLGQDGLIVKFISSANVACGFHAGDPIVMDETVRLVAENGIGCGAHPGFPDLLGFGRREMMLSSREIRASVIYQLGALSGFAGRYGIRLQHVKPHGALYNMAARDYRVARAVAEAVACFDHRLILLCPAGSEMARAGREVGLCSASEVFADRAYESDGTLVRRSEPGSVIDHPDEVAERVLGIVMHGRVRTRDGGELKVSPDSICIHGDTPGAPALAERIRKVLLDFGVSVEPLGGFLRC